MDFSTYALGLMPFLATKPNEADYFVELIGHFVKVAAHDNCKVLNHVRPDTQYKYIHGNPISKKDCQYLFQNCDRDRYTEWIEKKVEDTDSYDEISQWLKTNGKQGLNISDDCLNLLLEIFQTRSNENSARKKTTPNPRSGIEKINQLVSEIDALPKPPEARPPEEIIDEEEVYISQLCLAYKDVEPSLTLDHISNYSDFEDDLKDRRIEYFSAAAIDRGMMELDISSLTGQFDVLKDEIYGGVKNTLRRSHPNGYERMLAVMEHADKLPIYNYLLAEAKYWLNGDIKRGVCHHLVNEKRMEWVKK